SRDSAGKKATPRFTGAANTPWTFCQKSNSNWLSRTKMFRRAWTRSPRPPTPARSVTANCSSPPSRRPSESAPRKKATRRC
ncbi:uncharacterized protein METZ01_LOCUS235764, partial [marine metagenome]